MDTVKSTAPLNMEEEKTYSKKLAYRKSLAISINFYM